MTGPDAVHARRSTAAPRSSSPARPAPPPGVYADRGGPLIVETLRELGCRTCPTPTVVPDGPAVAEALRGGAGDRRPTWSSPPAAPG